MGTENLMTFIITALFFIMTPGIDTVFVLNKSISQGAKSGFYATLGINSGVFVHTFFAALGLSILIANSTFALTFIKILGAGYLICIGLFKFKNKKEFFSANKTKVRISSKNDFWSGFLTNTLNPKVALFFLAFFPQFIEASQISNPIPFFFLGTIYALIGVVWYLILSLFASAFSQNLKNNPQSSYWLNKLSGLVFIVMGMRIAFT